MIVPIVSHVLAGYAYSMHIASGKDLVVVGLIDVASALHTFLVPQIEPHLVLGAVSASG